MAPQNAFENSFELQLCECIEKFDLKSKLSIGDVSWEISFADYFQKCYGYIEGDQSKIILQQPFQYPDLGAISQQLEMSRRMDEVQKIAGQLMVVLWYAHSFGFCVNDLRLGNVLVSDNCCNVVLQNISQPLHVTESPLGSEISHPFPQALLEDLEAAIDQVYKFKVRPETNLEKLLEKILVPNAFYCPPEKFELLQKLQLEAKKLVEEKQEQEQYLKSAKQLLTQVRVPGQADFYQLGMLLFKMVFGDISPYGFYSEGTTAEWIAQNAPLLELEEIRPNPYLMSEEEKMQLGDFYDFIKKLMHKDPQQRLYSCEDVMEQPFMQHQWGTDLKLEWFTMMDQKIVNLLDVKFKAVEQVFEKSLLMQKVVKVELAKSEPRASEISASPESCFVPLSNTLAPRKIMGQIQSSENLNVRENLNLESETDRDEPRGKQLFATYVAPKSKFEEEIVVGDEVSNKVSEPKDQEVLDEQKGEDPEELKVEKEEEKQEPEKTQEEKMQEAMYQKFLESQMPASQPVQILEEELQLQENEKEEVDQTEKETNQDE